MIVIATHNGIDYLPGLIDSIREHGSCGHRVVVIDTHSEDPRSLDYIRELSKDPDFTVVSLPDAVYDTGAYIYAYRHFEAEFYLFMHDSMLAKDDRWVRRFEEKFEGDVGAVFLQRFPWRVENADQLRWLQESLPFDIASLNLVHGCAGPIFYTSRKVLRLADSKKCLEMTCTNKNQQEAMERGWPGIFKYLGVEVTDICGPWNRAKWLGDKYEGIRKFFPRRQ